VGPRRKPANTTAGHVCLSILSRIETDVHQLNFADFPSELDTLVDLGLENVLPDDHRPRYQRSAAINNFRDDFIEG
jgi:hypothetical protein